MLLRVFEGCWQLGKLLRVLLQFGQVMECVCRFGVFTEVIKYVLDLVGFG